MLKIVAPAAAVLGLFAATAAFAQTPAAVAAPAAAPTVGTVTTTTTTTTTTPVSTAGAAKHFTSASSLVDIMNNPAAKAAMAKTLPDLIPILEMFLDQIPPEATLDGLPDLSMGMVTPDQVKTIDADLRKI